MRFFPIALLVLALAAPALLSAQGLEPVVNNGTNPVCIMEVGQQDSSPEYRADNWSARLCVGGGETMQMTNGDFPPLTFGVVSGGGYYEADGGSVVIVGTAFGVKFKRIKATGRSLSAKCRGIMEGS